MPNMKSTAGIRNCQFAFRCTSTWDSLQRSEKEGIRYCTDCEKDVHFCRTAQELSDAVRLDRCVAIVLQNEIETEKSIVPESMIIGMPDISPYTTSNE